MKKRLKQAAIRLFSRAFEPHPAQENMKVLHDIIEKQNPRPNRFEQGAAFAWRILGIRSKKGLSRLGAVAVPLAVLAIAQLPAVSFAYGEQITNAGLQLYTWIRGAGAVVTCLGLAIGGVRFAMGDHEAAVKCGKVVLGGLIIMLAPAIIGLLQGVAGGAAAINTNG